MLTDKIKKLQAARARAAELEKSIANQIRKKLASLPGEYGFDSVEDFIAAVRVAGGGKAGRPRGRPPGSTNSTGRRHRAVITDATRSQVKSMVESGKTGAAIAKALKISLPSVQNIKKALGLVRARRK